MEANVKQPENSQQIMAMLSGVINKVKEREALDKSTKDLREQAEAMVKDIIDKKYGDYWQKVEKPATYEYEVGGVYDASESDSIAKMVATPSSWYGSKSDYVKRLQQWNDRVLIASRILKASPKALNIWKDFHSDKNELKKALSTGVAGQGSEYMPTEFSSDFIENVETGHILFGLHSTITIPRKVDKLKIPAEGTKASIYLLSEATADDSAKIRATTPGTRNIELDPVKFGSRAVVSAEMDEDSAVAVSDFVRTQLIKAWRRGISDAFINGDTAATHQDTDVTNSYDHRKAFTGYRKAAQSAAKIDFSDAVTVANIRKVLTNMGKYAKPTDLVLLTNMASWWKLMVLAEVLTVDKYSNKATILTGELGSLFSIPIIQEDQVREDLNASGAYDGTTTNRSELVLINKPGFIIGLKRDATIKTVDDAEVDQVKLVLTGRLDFKQVYASTEKVVGVGYNINVTT